ncbi:DUF6056 family protein [Neobacillus sp. 179-J 1A1 HS]|uniref:DUF6056 family protein n=1 Tax=Neobacillus driksii TaxID=3035913 RepID=UPI0035BBD490
MYIFQRSKLSLIILLFLILYGVHFAVSPYPGDDLFYKTASQNYSILEWIQFRYFEWSGRIIPDILSYYLLDGKLWIWRLLNPFIILLLAYSIIRIIKGHVSTKYLVLAILTLGYIHQGVLSSGFFWVTGSLNYLWPIALGLFAMIPLADKVFRDKKNSDARLPFIIFILCGFLASISNEQVALCISCFSIAAHICLFFQHKHQETKFFIFTGIMVIGTIILLIAPGNQVRMESEIASWYPEFNDLSFLKHLYVGVVWFFDKMFNEMRILVFTLAAITVTGYLLDSELRKLWLSKFFALLFAIILGALLLGNEMNLFYNFSKINTINITPNFTYLWEVKYSLIIALIPYLFWSAFSLILIILVVRKSENRFFILLCFLGLIASIAVMFFSPTIYASGRRVLTVGSVLFSLINIYFLIKHKMLDNKLGLLVYSIIPVINLISMTAKWLAWGFKPFL